MHLLANKPYRSYFCEIYIFLLGFTQSSSWLKYFLVLDENIFQKAGFPIIKS